MIEPFMQTVDDEQNKFFLEKNPDAHTEEAETVIVQVIARRCLYMIERAALLTQQKLLTSFKPIFQIKDHA